MFNLEVQPSHSTGQPTSNCLYEHSPQCDFHLIHWWRVKCRVHKLLYMYYFAMSSQEWLYKQEKHNYIIKCKPHLDSKVASYLLSTKQESKII